LTPRFDAAALVSDTLAGDIEGCPPVHDDLTTGRLMVIFNFDSAPA
jgi:hypothetical protein